MKFSVQRVIHSCSFSFSTLTCKCFVEGSVVHIIPGQKLYFASTVTRSGHGLKFWDSPSNSGTLGNHDVYMYMCIHDLLTESSNIEKKLEHDNESIKTDQHHYDDVEVVIV